MVHSGDHFALENWADFVRGHAASELATDIQEHLEAGCGSCSRSAMLWRQVVEYAGREQSFNPPDSDMRWARALYSSLMPRTGQTWKLRIARMLGQAQPALAGVRGPGPSSSHYLFQEGNVLLDVQLDTSAAGAVSIVGQVFDADHPEQRYQGRSVSLRRHEDVLTNSTTDQFGEFQLEAPAQEDLLLVIELDGESYLVSSLPALGER